MQAVIYDQIANRPTIEMRWEKVYFPQNSFLILKKNFLLISRLRRSFAHNNYQKFQIANTPTSSLALKVNQELEVAVFRMHKRRWRRLPHSVWSRAFSIRVIGSGPVCYMSEIFLMIVSYSLSVQIPERCCNVIMPVGDSFRQLILFRISDGIQDILYHPSASCISKISRDFS